MRTDPGLAATPQPAHLRRRISLLAVGYGALVLYGSLIPFHVTALPLAEALARFSEIPFLSLGPGRRADWVANILLYVPLAFLWCARAGLRPSPRRGSAAAVLAACIGFAVLVEFTQLWFAPRTVSCNDIVAEAIGSAIGAATWALWGRRLIVTWGSLARGGPAGLAAALATYGGIFAALVLFPFDFVIAGAELQHKLGGIAAVLTPSCGGMLKCGLKLSVEAAMLVPVGFLLALRARQRGGRAPGILAGAATGAAIGLVIELCQVFLVSGVTQGVSIVTRAAGMALGVQLGRSWDAQLVIQRIRSARPALVVAALAYALLLAALFGRGDWHPGAAAARLDALSWLPFYYHYFTSEQEALMSLLSNAALYAPIGGGLWLWRFAATGGRIARLPGAASAATAAALLAFVLEGSRVFKTYGHADPTNILIAAVAASLAFRGAGWLAACLLPDALRPVRSFRR